MLWLLFPVQTLFSLPRKPEQSWPMYNGTEVGSCVGSGHITPHAVFPCAVFSSPNLFLSKWIQATWVSRSRICLGPWLSWSMASPCPISGDAFILGGIRVLQRFPNQICPVLCQPATDPWVGLVPSSNQQGCCHPACSSIQTSHCLTGAAWSALVTWLICPELPFLRA